MFKNYKDDINLGISYDDFKLINGKSIDYIKNNHPSLYSLLISSKVLQDDLVFSDKIYDRFISNGSVPFIESIKNITDNDTTLLLSSKENKLLDRDVIVSSSEDVVDGTNFIGINELFLEYAISTNDDYSITFNLTPSSTKSLFSNYSIKYSKNSRMGKGITVTPWILTYSKYLDLNYTYSAGSKLSFSFKPNVTYINAGPDQVSDVNGFYLRSHHQLYNNRSIQMIYAKSNYTNFMYNLETGDVYDIKEFINNELSLWLIPILWSPKTLKRIEINGKHYVTPSSFSTLKYKDYNIDISDYYPVGLYIPTTMSGQYTRYTYDSQTKNTTTTEVNEINHNLSGNDPIYISDNSMFSTGLIFQLAQDSTTGWGVSKAGFTGQHCNVQFYIKKSDVNTGKLTKIGSMLASNFDPESSSYIKNINNFDNNFNLSSLHYRNNIRNDDTNLINVANKFISINSLKNDFPNIKIGFQDSTLNNNIFRAIYNSLSLEDIPTNDIDKINSNLWSTSSRSYSNINTGNSFQYMSGRRVYGIKDWSGKTPYSDTLDLSVYPNLSLDYRFIGNNSTYATSSSGIVYGYYYNSKSYDFNYINDPNYWNISKPYFYSADGTYPDFCIAINLYNQNTDTYFSSITSKSSLSLDNIANNNGFLSFIKCKLPVNFLLTYCQMTSMPNSDYSSGNLNSDYLKVISCATPTVNYNLIYSEKFMINSKYGYLTMFDLFLNTNCLVPDVFTDYSSLTTIAEYVRYSGSNQWYADELLLSSNANNFTPLSTTIEYYNNLKQFNNMWANYKESDVDPYTTGLISESDEADLLTNLIDIVASSTSISQSKESVSRAISMDNLSIFDMDEYRNFKGIILDTFIEYNSFYGIVGLLYEMSINSEYLNDISKCFIKLFPVSDEKLCLYSNCFLSEIAQLCNIRVDALIELINNYNYVNKINEFISPIASDFSKQLTDLSDSIASNLSGSINTSVTNDLVGKVDSIVQSFANNLTSTFQTYTQNKYNTINNYSNYLSNSIRYDDIIDDKNDLKLSKLLTSIAKSTASDPGATLNLFSDYLSNEVNDLSNGSILNTSIISMKKVSDALNDATQYVNSAFRTVESTVLTIFKNVITGAANITSFIDNIYLIKNWDKILLSNITPPIANLPTSINKTSDWQSNGVNGIVNGNSPLTYLLNNSNPISYNGFIDMSKVIDFSSNGGVSIPNNVFSSIKGGIVNPNFNKILIIDKKSVYPCFFINTISAKNSSVQLLPNTFNLTKSDISSVGSYISNYYQQISQDLNNYYNTLSPYPNVSAIEEASYIALIASLSAFSGMISALQSGGTFGAISAFAATSGLVALSNGISLANLLSKRNATKSIFSINKSNVPVYSEFSSIEKIENFIKKEVSIDKSNRWVILNLSGIPYSSLRSNFIPPSYLKKNTFIAKNIGSIFIGTFFIGMAISFGKHIGNKISNIRVKRAKMKELREQDPSLSRAQLKTIAYNQAGLREPTNASGPAYAIIGSAGISGITKAIGVGANVAGGLYNSTIGKLLSFNNADNKEVTLESLDRKLDTIISSTTLIVGISSLLSSLSNNFNTIYDQWPSLYDDIKHIKIWIR